MAHKYEYKWLLHFAYDVAPGKTRNGHPVLDKQGKLITALEDYGKFLPDQIDHLPGLHEWEVVSHDVSFFDNSPVVTILLRRVRNNVLAHQ
jgi:hypothetical protein